MRSGFLPAAAAALLLFCAREASAQIKPFERPDPKSITVPGPLVAPNPREVHAYGSDFIFYKAGVSYESAFADLDQCRIYAEETDQTPLPRKFIPFGTDLVSAGNAQLAPTVYAYGAVGVVVGGIMLAEQLKMLQAETNFRCMYFKGYTRYQTSHANWKKINAGSDEESLARMALIASGLQPAGGEIQ